MRVRAGKSLLLAAFGVFVIAMAACTTTATGPTGATTTTLPPAGVHTGFVFDCQALGAVQVDVPGGITVDAPATVNQFENFTIDYVIDQITIPASASGASISEVGGWNFRFTMPTNATFVSASLTGGQGYTGTATVAESGGLIEFNIAGSAPALGTVDYPIISVTMTAGPSGATVETSVGGTSYGDPGLTFSSATNFGIVGTACFPYAPAPIFSSTAIVGGDPEPATGCYPGSGNWLNDPLATPSVSYEGPINVVGNTSWWANVDGTCANAGFIPFTTVYGPDVAGADAKCLGLLQDAALANFQPMGAEYFLCALP